MSDIEKMKAEAGLKKVLQPSLFDRLMQEKHDKRRARVMRRSENGPMHYLEKNRLDLKKKQEARKKNKAAKTARRRNRK